MPIADYNEALGPERQLVRGTANGRPTAADRGLPIPSGLPDQDGLTKRVKSKGYELDFKPDYGGQPKIVRDVDGLTKRARSKGYELDFKPNYGPTGPRKRRRSPSRSVDNKTRGLVSPRKLEGFEVPWGSLRSLDPTEMRKALEIAMLEEERSAGNVREFFQSYEGGYKYQTNFIIGQAVPGEAWPSDKRAMAALVLNPNEFFPFDVVGRNGETSIEKGHEYDLVNKASSPYWPLPNGKHPIEVTALTENSFTFATGEGHLDKKGSTITFTTFTDREGQIHLQHYANALPGKPKPILYLAPAITRWTWKRQATNLSKFLQETKPLILSPVDHP